MKVHMVTEDLVIHTIKITSNPKVFDPKYQSLINKIVDCAIEIGQCLWDANGVMVGKDANLWRLRSGLQDRACMKLNTLLYLITLSKRTFHLRRCKFDYWVRLAQESRKLATKWRDSDRRRYGYLG